MFGHLPRPPGPKKPEHCRDEKISATGNPTCIKRVARATELLANECRNCGRPFELTVMVEPPKEEDDGA